ncbi:RNA polymerase sigma factor [Cytobacillus sp. FJAT-54145]|uniref:RNA polymerase sigma factor n=1 Tax=Cytobacillus spartinae TaxID=3299023 RepID=A0ABW6KFD9_9BACI
MEDQHRWNLLEFCLNKYYDEILNYMNLRLHNKEDARDLTQETFLLITKHIESYQQLSSLRTWCFTIAKNVLVDHYRKRGRIKQLFLKVVGASSLKKETNHFEEYSHFRFLLQELSAEEQDLIILKHYFGFTYKEIAEISKLSESNVGVKLSRAISKINELEKRGESDEFHIQGLHAFKNK